MSCRYWTRDVVQYEEICSWMKEEELEGCALGFDQ